MVKCNDHPCAPHGYDRSSSHAEGRYVCDCEAWEPPENCDGTGCESPWYCNREEALRGWLLVQEARGVIKGSGDDR